MKKFFRIMMAMCLVVMLTFTCVACGNKPAGGGDDTDPDPKPGPAPVEVTISFGMESIDINTGKEYEVKVTVTGSNEDVEFTSSDETNFDVEAKDKTTAIIFADKDGDYELTASIGNKSAKLAVHSLERGIKVVGGKTLSVAPGDTHEFDVELKNVTGTITVESSLTGITAKVKEGTATETGATIEFTGANNLELGKTATLTIEAGTADPAEIQVDTYSKGILLGDGNYQTTYLAVDSTGVVARGVGSDFVSGALVIPRYIYYTPAQHIDVYRNNEYKDEANQESFWAPVVNVGVRTGDHDREGEDGRQPGKGDTHGNGCHHDIYKFETDDPFYIEDGKTITELNTGDSVTAIAPSAFKDVNSIRKVHLGKAMVHVCDNAFDNQSAFTNTNGTYTFDGTVKELTFSKETKIGVIGLYAFRNNELTKLILPDSVGTIATSAFHSCGTEILKLPAAWRNQGFGFIFAELFNLKELYIPWQNCYSMSATHWVDDSFKDNTDAAKKAAYEESEALAAELGFERSDYIVNEKRNNKDYAYHGYSNFAHYEPFIINGEKDALNNATSTNKVKVFYLGPKVLMDNAISVTNHIRGYGVIWAYKDGTFGTEYSEDNVASMAHDDTGGRQLWAYNDWRDPVGDNFRKTFFHTEEITTPEYNTQATVFVYGNDKVEWIFDQTCPYEVDGTTKA